MNFRKEPFPKSFDQLIKKSELTAKEIQRRLQSKSCPKYDELFNFNSSRVVKHDQFFDRLQVYPNEQGEIKGLYIFGQQTAGIIKPVYIGISGKVCKRLKNHICGKTHNQATLAFLSATFEQKYDGRRAEFDFSHVVRHQIETMRDFRVVVIPEETDYDLYFMEVYIAGKIKTKWNSFKTH